MVQPQTSETKPLKKYSTAELKQQLIEIAQPHDTDSLSDKIKFYQKNHGFKTLSCKDTPDGQVASLTKASICAIIRKVAGGQSET